MRCATAILDRPVGGFLGSSHSVVQSHLSPPRSGVQSHLDCPCSDVHSHLSPPRSEMASHLIHPRFVMYHPARLLHCHVEVVLRSNVSS